LRPVTAIKKYAPQNVIAQQEGQKPQPIEKQIQTPLKIGTLKIKNMTLHAIKNIVKTIQTELPTWFG